MWPDLTPTAVLIPSLNRPQRIKPLYENLRKCTDPRYYRPYFCVGDEESLDILDQLEVPAAQIIDDTDCDDKRYVTRMNKLVQLDLGNAKTLFFGSDDVIHRYGWLENALEVMDSPPYPDVVVVNDMHNPNGTQAVMRREYLESAVVDAPGLAFHPGYRHQFADNEQFATAMARNTFARAMSSCVEHLHPLFKSENSLPDDDTYRQAQAWQTWLHDTELWKQRQVEIVRHFTKEVSA